MNPLTGNLVHGAEIIVCHTVKNSFALYGTQRFITVLTRASQRSVPRTRWIRSTPPRPIYVSCILILSSHLQPGLQSGLFPSDFPIKTLYVFLSHMCAVHCPTQPTTPPWFDHPNNIDKTSHCAIFKFSPASCYLVDNEIKITMLSMIHFIMSVFSRVACAT
jgi:hypothetical protein